MLRPLIWSLRFSFSCPALLSIANVNKKHMICYTYDILCLSQICPKGDLVNCDFWHVGQPFLLMFYCINLTYYSLKLELSKININQLIRVYLPSYTDSVHPLIILGHYCLYILHYLSLYVYVLSRSLPPSSQPTSLNTCVV